MRQGLLVLLLLVLLLPGRSAQAAELCFAETPFCMDGPLRDYWEQNGGLAVFGYPISAPRQELNRDTQQVYVSQWFERNRLELHPENAAPYGVLLGRLGAESLPTNLPLDATTPESGPRAGCRWFDITQHNVCDQEDGRGFLSYWQGHGLRDPQLDAYAQSLQLFGLPLTAPVFYTNSSGDTVLTQWFERARFEWHPGNPREFRVLLGRLGAEVYDPARPNGEALRFQAVQRPGWPQPLEVPLGFTIDEAANGLNGPRFMALDPADGSLVVADFKANALVRLRDDNGDGFYERHVRIAGDFDVMHSVAFLNGQLYAADERHLFRLGDFGPDGAARQREVLLELPAGATDLYGHRTRTVAAGPDGRLYLSIGSSCDVCEETNAWRAALLRMDAAGRNVEVLATGLRNTVGFAWRPYTDELWGVDMGRNNIGAGVPPDELNRIEPGRNYGWPYCYGANLPNPEYNDPARCASTVAPALELPAHWSPLGLAFYAQLAFPPTYFGDALIAFHGTGADQVGNQLAGYRVSRVRFANGQPGGLEDLVRGWERDNTFWGRPVGLLVAQDGSLLISDDVSGRVYRLRYTGMPVAQTGR